MSSSSTLTGRPELSWDEVAEALRHAWFRWGLPDVTPFVEREVPQRRVGGMVLAPVIYEMVDVARVEGLLDMLRTEGPLTPSYSSYKGIFCTVESLWEVRDAPDLTRAVWTVALAQDDQRQYVLWYAFVEACEKRLRQVERMPLYHHRNRALHWRASLDALGLPLDHRFQDATGSARYVALNAATLLARYRFLRIRPVEWPVSADTNEQ